jgi:hypothetical protein
MSISMFVESAAIMIGGGGGKVIAAVSQRFVITGGCSTILGQQEATPKQNTARSTNRISSKYFTSLCGLARLFIIGKEVSDEFCNDHADCYITCVFRSQQIGIC